MLSVLIFAIEIDWIMSSAAKRDIFGLSWIEEDKQKDLDFADYIVLLGSRSTWNGIKDLTKRVQAKAAKVGFAINPDKTKVMKIGKWQETDWIKIDEVTI